MAPVHTKLAAIGLCAVAAASIGAWSSATAQSPAARILTFSEPDKGSTFEHHRGTKGAPRTANLQADVIAFSNPIVDGAGKRIGTTHVGCVTTVGALDFAKSMVTCNGVLALRDGTLAVQGLISPKPGAVVTMAVTGGTGAYAGVRGVLVSKPAKTGANDTVTLTE
jgi:hypothetical protein